MNSYLRLRRRRKEIWKATPSGHPSIIDLDCVLTDTLDALRRMELERDRLQNTLDDIEAIAKGAER